MGLDDVDLSDADADRADRLSSTTEFTPDEAGAIVRFARVPESDRDPSLIRNYVSNGESNRVEDGITPTVCAQIRRDMDRADRPTTVIAAHPDKHPSVIFRHATGRCDHDVDVDPTTSPRIMPGECREMRVDFQTGDDFDTICESYNRSENAVTKHVFGRCDHDFKSHRNGKRTAKVLCHRMRKVYRETEVSIEDVGNAFLLSRAAAHRHLTGACKHDDDVEPPCKTHTPDPIDDAECDRMRAGYGNGVEPGEIAGTFDRDAVTVRKHVFGRCRHGESPYSPDRDAVGPTRCKAIRHEYRTRGVESVASVADRLGTSKGTFYYHLYGDCDHDVGVDPVERDG